MALGEFQLIQRFFTHESPRPDVLLGVGDDCALLRPEPGKTLAVTTDTLVSGVHFLPEVNPESLGHKALAVNLSDLAAMGAAPAWATLALTLPKADAAWLEAFARGFWRLADQCGVALVGGDTTRGPLSITVQAMGWVEAGAALRRSAALPGDGVYLTGELGLAGLGLAIALGQTPQAAADALAKLERPQPRIQAGLALAGLAHACIDVSDGLCADLGHILAASGVGATLDFAALPLPAEVRRHIEATGDWKMPLCAGDDYELCFTLDLALEDELRRRMERSGCAYARIGRIEDRPGLRLRHANGDIGEWDGALGFQHFPGG
jgi:thiamine-monophosphate kinase